MIKLPEHIKIRGFEYQCGMNYIENLGSVTTLEQQIEVLDWAFTHWGLMPDQKKELWIKSDNPNQVSQIIFTDNVGNEAKVWPEIKKIAVRGPITHNRRYQSDPERKITTYVLTWDAYSHWKEKRAKAKEPELMFKPKPIASPW